MFSRSQLVAEALSERAKLARKQAIELRARLNDPDKFYSEHNLLRIHQEALSHEICALVLDVRAESMADSLTAFARDGR